MTDAQTPNPASGGTPGLDDDKDTVAIPRPANELDGEPVQEEPDDDPQKAG